MKINRGQKPQYYVEDMNPPIITKEVFEAAQKLKAKSTTEERFSVQERPAERKNQMRMRTYIQANNGKRKNLLGMQDAQL